VIAMRKPILVAAAALAALTATPAAAPAATGPVARSVTQVPQGAQTSIEGNRMSGAYVCAATATPDAASVNITMCQVRTSSGATYDSALTVVQPGPVSATGGAFARIPIQTFQVCMQTEVIWLDGAQIRYPVVCR
jgi:hypothetical protein